MVSIIWKLAPGWFFTLVLLLSGDVHLNPGPSAAFPCRVCQKEVLDSDPAVQCDQCDMWVHVTCDCSLTINDYNEMLANPSDDLFFVASLPFIHPSHLNQDCLVCVLVLGVL